VSDSEAVVRLHCPLHSVQMFSMPRYPFGADSCWETIFGLQLLLLCVMLTVF